LVSSAIVNLVNHPRREVIIPLKYQGIVWLDRLFPGVADVAFHWRHRKDKEKANYGILPAYTRSNELKRPE
jgi:hypothetical protein